jgi:DNA-binding transcriptional MerR regulator
VCFALGITKRTLQSYRDKRFVPYSNVGGKYFYRESDVAAYLEARTKGKIAAGTALQSEPGSQPQNE